MKYLSRTIDPGMNIHIQFDTIYDSIEENIIL